MKTNKFQSDSVGNLKTRSDGSATSAFVITPSDSTTILTRGLFVGTGGNLAVIHTNDSVSVFYKNIADGSTLPFSVKKVLATGTTCADIVGLI